MIKLENIYESNDDFKHDLVKDISKETIPYNVNPNGIAQEVLIRS